MASAEREQMIANLNDCLSTLTHSLATYILNSGAYVSASDKDAVGAMQEIAAADENFSVRVVRLIDDLGGISQLTVTNPDYGHLNYLSYPYLLDVMIKYKQVQTEIYKGLVESVGNYPEVRKLYRDILAAHEAHLTKVEGIRANRYKSAEPEPEPEPDEPATSEAPADA